MATFKVSMAILTIILSSAITEDFTSDWVRLGVLIISGYTTWLAFMEMCKSCREPKAIVEVEVEREPYDQEKDTRFKA